MDAKLTAKQLEVWRLFLQIHSRLPDRLRADMASDVGLPLSWFDVMLQLSLVPGGQLRMNELLRNLMLTRSGLTRRVDRMEARGLVCRHGDAADARGVIVTLTPEGMDCLRKATPGHRARIARYFTCHFTDEEAEAAGSAFRKILTALDESPSDENTVSR